MVSGTERQMLGLYLREHDLMMRPPHPGSTPDTSRPNHSSLQMVVEPVVGVSQALGKGQMPAGLARNLTLELGTHAFTFR